jgi:tight adherence protein B
VTAVLVAFLLALALALLLWGRGAAKPVPARARSAPRRQRSTSPWSLPRRRRRGRAVERAAVEILDVLDALAPALRAGLPPAAALRLVTRSGAPSGPRPSTSVPSGSGALDDLAEAAAQGGPLAPTWSAYADALSSSDLRLVAAAWSLCDALGSPLAPTVATVADAVRRRRAVRQRIAAASAGPRATMRVLTALPLTGPLVALAVGVSPGDLYAEPAGAASLVVGLVLLLLGRFWAGRLVGAVAAEPRPPWRSRWR